MPQPTVKQLFAASSAKASDNGPLSDAVAGSNGSKVAAAATPAAGSMQHQLKENKPAAAAAAAAAEAGALSRDSKQQLSLQVAPAASKPNRGVQLSKGTQLYLDLGQRDFGASRCSVCGMVYAKGHDEDEKLHKAYHQGAVQGFKFQGWPQERVLVSEVAQGRLLMVLQTDPANHVKKVRELCAFVEKAHGMSPGWLLAAPQARVFLYVSSKGRVVGLAVAEPLKQAYRVLAPEGCQEQEVDSTACVQQRQQPGRTSILDAAALPAHQEQQQQKAPKRQQQQLLWPGLRKRGRLAALGRAAGSGGSMLQSDPPLCSDSAGAPSCNLKADSCPTSLLAAAGRLQVQQAGSAEEPCPASAGAAAAAVVNEAAAAAITSAAGQEQGQLLALSQPSLALHGAPGRQQQQEEAEQPAQQPHEQQQQQQQQVQQEPGLSSKTAAALQMPPPHSQQQQQQRVPPWQRDAAAAHTRSGAGGSVLSAGGAMSAGGGSGMARRGASGAAAAAAAATAGQGGGSSRSLLVDQHRAVRAMVGVRMVWVSPEQRRKGLATKLLDAARCNMVPGYVVPCNQVAFSQPTGDGVALAAAFARTQQFLVYGIK